MFNNVFFEAGLNFEKKQIYESSFGRNKGWFGTKDTSSELVNGLREVFAVFENKTHDEACQTRNL